MDRPTFILAIGIILMVVSVTITPYIIQVQINNATIHRDKQFKIILDSLDAKSNEHKELLNEIKQLESLVNGSK